MDLSFSQRDPLALIYQSTADAAFLAGKAFRAGSWREILNCAVFKFPLIYLFQRGRIIMTLEKQLEQIGFHEKEAKMYLACLQLGQDTAYHIAQKCGLKRATVYFTLNLLVERGLVSIWKTKKATLWRAANPKKLFTQIKRKKERNAHRNLSPAPVNLQLRRRPAEYSDL
jgi:predicted transcriptional regulator